MNYGLRDAMRLIDRSDERLAELRHFAPCIALNDKRFQTGIDFHIVQNLFHIRSRTVTCNGAVVGEEILLCKCVPEAYRRGFAHVEHLLNPCLIV